MIKFKKRTTIQQASSTKYQELEDACSIFFCKKREFRHDSRCPISCNIGWYQPLSELFSKIESLNLQYYEKYRVRAVARQVKEKFGTLRVYYDVTVDPSFIVKFFKNLLLDIEHVLSNVKYGLATVIDEPRHCRREVKELTKQDFDNEKAKDDICNNVLLTQIGTKYFKITDINVYGSSHQIPTRHKMLWALKNFIAKFNARLSSLCYSAVMSSQQKVIIGAMNSFIEKWVDEAETECMKVCERCGSQIGTEWSPTCTTKGWISYICSKCAENDGRSYVKNGELWKGKTLITAKDQYKAEQEINFNTY